MARHAYPAGGVQASSAWEAYQNLRRNSTSSGVETPLASLPAWVFQTCATLPGGRSQPSQRVSSNEQSRVAAVVGASSSSASRSASCSSSHLSRESGGSGGCLRTSIQVSSLQRGAAASRAKSPLSDLCACASSTTSGSSRCSPHGSLSSGTLAPRISLSPDFVDIPAARTRTTAAARSGSLHLPVDRQSRSAARSAFAQNLRWEHNTDGAMNSEQMEAIPTLCLHGEARTAFGESPKEVSKFVQVVSLGNSCATKLSMRRLETDEATLPLDWIRSSIDGLIHWLRHDFDGFITAERKYDLVLKECAMTVHRSPTHSFWHDDVDDAVTQEKLRRRVDRFLDLASDTSQSGMPRALLFVRSVACSAELSKTEQLFELLCERFERYGRKVYLLMIVDGQPFAGPVLHATHEDHLLFWLQPTFSGELALDCISPAPYEEAIAFALRRVLHGRSEEEEAEWPRVDQAADIVQETGKLWQLGVRTTDAGLWVGTVLLRGASEETKFAAFEGIDDNAPFVPTRLARSSKQLRMSPRRRSYPAWLGA